MVENRSAALGTVFPTLAYDDVGAAIDWLCSAFGFAERFRYGPPGQPQGAMLTVGAGSVMLTAAREADPSGEWWARVALRQPRADEQSCSIGVRVEDVDAHHERARRAGARILNPPETYLYGERQYSVLDLAGHRWNFTQSVADLAPQEWGGESPVAS
jgi:uncharacterized glyoxalase superfamily protein PhnB